MAKKKVTAFRLSDEDIALLRMLQGELSTTDLKMSQADIISLALKNVKDSGGVPKVLQRRLKRRA